MDKINPNHLTSSCEGWNIYSKYSDRTIYRDWNITKDFLCPIVWYWESFTVPFWER